MRKSNGLDCSHSYAIKSNSQVGPKQVKKKSINLWNGLKTTFLDTAGMMVLQYGTTSDPPVS